jgi:hypothetical protein
MALFVGFFIVGVLSSIWYFEVWQQGLILCQPNTAPIECLRVKVPLIDVFLRKLL